MIQTRSAVCKALHHLSTSSNMVTSAEKQKFFLTHKKYAVVGASTDPSKWGTKASWTILVSLTTTKPLFQILQWYIARDKDVTPVHPVS